MAEVAEEAALSFASSIANRTAVRFDQRIFANRDSRQLIAGMGRS
jgi:hypothetical protein